MLVPSTLKKTEENDENSDFLNEIQQKVKENKAEIHEINTATSCSTEKMSDEAFFAICNPALSAFKEGLAELNRLVNDDLKKNNVEMQLEVIDQIHMVLLLGNEQLNLKIIEILPEFYSYLENPNLYDKVCTVLSDISHMNINVINSLLAFNIFDKLDYSRKSSFPLIFSICDNNKECWEKFQTVMNPKFVENQYIVMLANQHK